MTAFGEHSSSLAIWFPPTAEQKEKKIVGGSGMFMEPEHLDTTTLLM